MAYHCPILADEESLTLVHDALLLKWASLTKQIESSNDKENIKFFCRSLVRVIHLIQSMEEDVFDA